MMRTIVSAKAVLLSALLLAFAGTPVTADSGDVTVYTSEEPFDQVLQDLSDAVVNRGYKIDYEGHIGAMLDRTADDVGAKKTIYRHAEFVQFCSAVVSRLAMEADPLNIAFCPYVLFAYELDEAPGTVRVGFRRMPETGSDASKAAFAKVNALLDEIVREASGQ